MEGDRFSMIAQNYLKKRPRLTSDELLSGEHSSSSGSCVRGPLQSPSDLVNYSDEDIFIWQHQERSQCIIDNTVNRAVETYLSLHGEDDDNQEEYPSVYETPRNDYSEQSNFEESFAVTRAINYIGLQPNYGCAPSTSQQASSEPFRPSLLFQGSTWTEDATATMNGNTGAGIVDCVDTEPDTVANASDCHDQEEQGGDINNSEFIEAAVSVAIQEKGLAPLSNK